MRPTALVAGMMLLASFALSVPALATDVDGPDDCLRLTPPVDFGDAPEDVVAYGSGVVGHFPTCLADGAPGNRTFACPPNSSAPGTFTGFVRHQHPTGDRYWLGCPLGVNQPMGIDPEADGKVNATGGPFSACNNNITVDCFETVGLMTFGQDECYGSNDACLASAPTFTACGPGNVGWTIPAYSCATVAHQAYMNILVDWNHDGDWNDNLQCNGGCAYEWPVKNYLVTLLPGCNTIFPPTFRVGPQPGQGWMRITLSDEQVTNDFPWNGSAGMVTQELHNGETEDYPVRILPSTQTSCPSYEDWGDAPEGVQAYPGVSGNFPTCSFPGPTGTLEADCLIIGVPPGPTVGFVRHVSSADDPVQFWLGCGDPNAGFPGVDSETDGKTNDTGGPFSSCAAGVPIDCSEFLGLDWGQDECYGDGVDTGLVSPTNLIFKACQAATVDFNTFNCKLSVDAFLNILVDMNEDGDWNDNILCSAAGPCAYEWAVVNRPIVLAPGCEAHTSPAFTIGPHAGKGWLRITITTRQVGGDFPWNGSAGPTGDGFFQGGETEDYPVVIRPPNVGVDDAPQHGQLWLAPIAPNPGSDRVLVKFTLPQTEDVSLAVYDIVGRKLTDLARGSVGPGEHAITWNFRDASGREVGAGYYVVRLRVGDRVLTQRGMRVK